MDAGRSHLIIVANRGPLSITENDDGADEVARGGGGLVSAMQAALTASPDAVWICAAMNDRERALAREAPHGRMSHTPTVSAALHGDFDVVMLPIDALTYRQAYNGIANATLWFVLHMLFEPARTPVFDGNWRRQWAGYQRYNASFADAVVREAAEGATVMVQDYHLFLLPALLRRRRPDLRISHFTHTPWVSPDYFRVLPDDVAREILDGMLGADLLGFHTPRWSSLFSQCCAEVCGRPGRHGQAFGLTTDADEMHDRAWQRDVEKARRSLREVVGDRRVIARVDRTELSKNVLRGLIAYRELLRRWPDWRNHVVHAVFDYPSREDLPEYREYTAAIERLGREIDDEFGTEEWTPLVLEIEQNYPASLAAMRMADVVFVNPIRDGMNLVVLEEIVLSEHDPVVVLSREAGAADVLGGDALLVNPFDVSETAQALHDALSMLPGERAARAERLRKAASQLPPTAWFQAQLDALGAPLNRADRNA